MTDHIAELAFYITNGRASVRLLLSRTRDAFVHGYSAAQIVEGGVVIRPGHRRLSKVDRATYPAWGLTLSQNSQGWAEVPREPFALVPVDVVEQPGGSLLLKWPELHRCKPPRKYGRVKGECLDDETAYWYLEEAVKEGLGAILEDPDQFIDCLKQLKGRSYK